MGSVSQIRLLRGNKLVANRTRTSEALCESWPNHHRVARAIICLIKHHSNVAMNAAMFLRHFINKSLIDLNYRIYLLSFGYGERI